MDTSADAKMDFWASKWDNNSTGWHMDKVHPLFMKYFESVTKELEDQGQGDIPSRSSPKKFFVPLCGKTRDLAFILSKGYSVFAIEGVEKAIKELDAENGFNLKFDPEESLYSTEDGRLKIYFGDLASCPIEKWGPFDFVWDRGSFTAVEYGFRGTYLEVMKRSLKAPNSEKYVNFRYILNVIEYDKTKFGGPPRSTSEADVTEFFSGWTKVEMVEKNQLPETNRVRKIEGMGPDCFGYQYILRPL